MKLSYIVTRIRLANTIFGNYVGGSAELDLAITKNTLTRKEIAFVVPVTEDATANKLDSGISQLITEKFAVIVALANDSSQADKTGLTSYDLLHNIRSELFRSLVGWQIKGAESLIEYAGGRFISVRNSYLWWEFDFRYSIRLQDWEGYYCDTESIEDFIERKQPSKMDDFNSISSKYIFWPSENLPWKGTYDEVTGDISQMETWIDLTKDPDAGAYGRGFDSGFDFYRILNRSNDPK
jgi:hypothetical protein